MSRPRRVFSTDFKLRVLEEIASGASQASVARKYELSPHLLLLWKKALPTGCGGGGATGGPDVQLLLQDQKIKAEIIQEQTQEIHLLKKALSALKQQNASVSSKPNVKSSPSKKPAP
jgi:transposase-like protein